MTSDSRRPTRKGKADIARSCSQASRLFKTTSITLKNAKFRDLSQNMYLLNVHVHFFCQHFHLFFCMIVRDRTPCFPVYNVWFSRGFGTVLSQEILPAHLSSGRTWMHSRNLLLFCSCRRSVVHSHDSRNFNNFKVQKYINTDRGKLSGKWVHQDSGFNCKSAEIILGTEEWF